MKTEKMKVLLYLKKSGLDKSGKAPIMGRITIGRSIAQFSSKLSCNPDLWNPRESRMDGKSREAVEINGRLENLLLSIQSAYQSLIDKALPFDATDVKEQFQGCVQARCMLIERLDMLIKEKESHIGVDLKKESLSSYHSTRNRLQEFIQKRYRISDLAFSQLTENFIYEFRQYYLGVCGFQESSFFAVASHLKTVCRLAYHEGIADTLMFDKAHIERGDKKTPKALDKDALDKLKALRFDELEKEMETARDVFLFACYTGAAYCDLMELSKKHLVHDDAGSLWLKFIRQKTGVLCRIKLLPEAVRLIEKMHSDERETLLPCIKYKNYQTCLKALRLRAGISFPFTTHTARHTFATLITLEQGMPIETVSKMLLVGNVNIDSLRPLLCQYVASLPAAGRKESFANNLPEVRNVNETHVFTKKMNTPSALVTIIYTFDLPYTPKSNLALDALRRVLTIAFTDSIREEKGGAYGVGVQGELDCNSRPNLLLKIGFRTDPEKYAALMPIVYRQLAHVAHVAQGRINPESIGKIKTYLKKAHQQEKLVNDYWSNILYQQLRYCIDLHADYEALVDQLSAADIQQVAQAIIKSNRRIEITMKSG